MNRVGIDIGSTTVKIAIIDEQNKILFSAYERHYANIQETLRGIIERAYEQLGDQGDCTDDHRFRRINDLRTP